MAMEPIKFRVDGQPKGQPRPRAFARKMGSKFIARVYDDGTAEGWKGCVALAAKPLLPAAPLQGALSLTLTFYMPRPKSLQRAKDPAGTIPHIGKPDTDNLAKAVMDSLTQLGMWGDDSQIAELYVKKLYPEKVGKPGVFVIIEEAAG